MALTVKAQDAGVDITGQLTNPDFETGDNSGWTYGSGLGAGHAATAANYGYQGTHFMEAWTGSAGNLGNFDWYQTIEVPNGYYAVKALAHAVKQGQGENTPVSKGVYVYANDQQVEVQCTQEKPDEYQLFVKVTDGKLTIGYRAVSCNVNWVACDHFRVIQCFGDTEDAGKTSWLKCEMLLLQTDLESLIENMMSADLRDAINDSFGEIEAVSNYAEANALWSTMKAQAEEAEACVAAYEKLMLKIDELWTMVDDGADELEDVVADAEDMYYGEALSAAEALAEIEALNDAVFQYNLSQADGTVGFDVTEMYVTNPSWQSKESKTGWDIEVERKMNWGDFPAFGTDLAEVYQCDFNISQTLTDMPNGKYKVHVQGFYRGGTLTAELYANDDKVKLVPLEKYSTADFGSVSGVNASGYADNLTSASAVFNTLNPATGRNFYDENEVEVIVMDGTLKFGIRSYTTDMGTWCAFRNFRLEYYGNFPGINLYAKILKIEDTMSERFDEIPSAVRWEMEDFLASIEEYTEAGYSEEEVNEVILQLDAEWKKVEEAMAVYAELQARFDFADGELLDLEYPGADDLNDVLDEVWDCFDEESEENTYDYLVEMLAYLEEAISDYYFSQEASEDVAADYSFLVPNPNFEEKGEWTWSVVGGGSDQWIGNCRPTEDGGASRRGINLWGWGITSVDVHQVLTGLPNGLYRVSAELITQTNYATDQHVYAIGAATVESDYMTVEGWDTYEWETLTTNGFAVVVDGTLTIGAASSQGGTNSEAWFQATNFQLYYHGEASNEHLQAAWETLKADAEAAVDILIPNEEKEVAAALTEASLLGDAGNYVDACATLRPVLAAWDSTIVATQNFYGGYYAKLDTIRLYDAYDGCEMVYEFADVAVALADAILASDTASCKLFPALDAKLHAYANYAAALRDAENEMKNEDADYEQKYVDFLLNSIVEPQLAELTASLIEAADCDALTEELKKAVGMLQKSIVEYDDVEEGDVTYLIANADIESALDGTWNVVQGGAQNCGTNNNEHYSGVTNTYLDAWHPTAGTNTATFYQDLAGIPDGTYRLTVAARTDGGNVWIFAAPTSKVKDASTQFVEVVNNGAFGGAIWEEDKLAWEAAGRPTDNLTEDYPYFMARYNSETGEGEGYGWSWHVMEIEVTNRFLSIGISANAEYTGQAAFTGTWFGADDWKLELVKKSDVQSEYNPFLGVENLEVAAPVVKGIYDLFGRRLDAATAPGIYIVNGKKVVIK